MRRVQLVSHRILRFRRFCSTLPPANVDDVNLKSYLPSEDFLKQYVRRPSHRDKLTTLLSEVQTFLEMFGKDSLPEFDDSLWKTYFGTWSADDRCQLLNELRLERKNDERMADKPEKVQISVINQEREHNGEMVYAPGFHTLLELRGQEFRGDIDNIYGSRLLSLQRCDEELPKLLVDCRFMSEYSSAVQSKFAKQIQSLHDSNWTSRLPFNISIVNFRPDNHLAEIAKRQFLFHYGPPSSVNSSSFRRHPMAPAITIKGVQEAAECDRSDIMYISWRATQFLPDVAPSNVRAVVLCASTDFQPWSSSVSAAKKDRIDAYRLPLERYARFDNKSKYLPLSAVSSILRSYFRREDLGVSIRETVERQPKSARFVEQNEIELFEQYKCVIREAVAKAEAAASYEIYKKRDRTHSLPKKSKVHRYSREERRVMREKLQAEQS